MQNGAMDSAWPGDSATVTGWVKTLLQQAALSDELAIEGIDRVTVDADLRGTDLESLTLDGTRVRLRVQVDQPPSASDTATDSDVVDAPEPVRRERGVLRRFHAFANPLQIEKRPVAFDLALQDVPIEWLTFAEPTDPRVPATTVALVPAEKLDGMHGTFRASARPDDLVRVVTSVARPALRESGIHLGRVTLDVTDDGPDGIRIAAYAGMRWKVLLASVRVDAAVEVTRDGVLTVRELTLGSRNLLVKIVLRMVRRQVREAIGQSVDLNAPLSESGSVTRVHDVRVDAGARLIVSARFG